MSKWILNTFHNMYEYMWVLKKGINVHFSMLCKHMLHKS